VLSVIIGDINRERLAQVRSFGCETIDLTQSGELPDMIAQIVGEPVVDAAVDCVGFEAHGHGVGAGEVSATALNDVIGTLKSCSASAKKPPLLLWWRDPQAQSQQWEVRGSDMPSAGG
jgi:glutathione-independent formaldehyde dehydrogenase